MVIKMVFLLWIGNVSEEILLPSELVVGKIKIIEQTPELGRMALEGYETTLWS